MMAPPPTASSGDDSALATPAAHQRRVSPRRVGVLRSTAELPWTRFLLLVLVHAILAWLMKRWPILATAHAALVLLATMALALRNASPGRLLAAMAYLVGSEVLWRMTNAPRVPWEFGKYALVLIAMAALMRRWPARPSWLPVLYFGLLVPSSFLSFGSGDFNQIRQDISFNLSGPLCLAVLMFYFSGLKLQMADLTRCYQFMILPVAGICSIASFTLLTAEDLVFDGRSNAVASGGFAANQVSAILGLGVFVAFLYNLSPNLPRMRRGWLLGIALVFLAQCVVTFSRTGLYLAVCSIVVALLMLSSNVNRTLAAGGTVVLVTVVMAFLVWPALDRFTDGALSRRFQNTSSTGRDDIMASDLQLFFQSPLVGIGVGQSRVKRNEFLGKTANAHTEFSRLLAEHGFLGLLALGLLLVVACRNAWRVKFTYRGAVSAGAITWGMLFMMVSGMRLAAPAFLLGLSCATWVEGNRGIGRLKEAPRFQGQNRSDEFAPPSRQGRRIQKVPIQ
jgi:O-antigen ligase